MLQRKEMGLWFEDSSLEHFLYIGVILLVFRCEEKSSEKKNWLNGTAR